MEKEPEQQMEDGSMQSRRVFSVVGSQGWDL